MVKTLEEMAAKGQRKLAAKVSTMPGSWAAAKSRMTAHYAALPFGPRVKAAYAAGISAGVYHAPDPVKWAANWKAKMQE
uniref:Uncharacterized protein n=1 Tax=viral metagenome TaxID=1070528 RepID=A0A6M3IN12_9ZZZZ